MRAASSIAQHALDGVDFAPQIVQHVGPGERVLFQALTCACNWSM